MKRAGFDTTDQVDIPLRAIVLGGEIAGVDMTALRSDQINRAEKSAAMQLSSLIFAALANCWIGVFNHLPFPVIAGYAALVALTLGGRWLSRPGRRSGWIHGGESTAYREIALGSASGLLLASPAIYFAITGNHLAIASVTIVFLGMMAIYGYSSASVPILYCSMMPIICLVCAAALAATGNPLPALAILAFLVASVSAVLAAGRDFIHFEIVGRKAEERGETVSLLLREFEDTGADWLWQIDANRRITRASGLSTAAQPRPSPIRASAARPAGP